VAKPSNWELSENVVGACIEVHRQLGPGLLESVYEAALCEELTLRSVPFVQQSTFPVTYKGRTLDQVYRIDLVVAACLIVEVKSVERLLPVHEAQALTYLRLTTFDSALLVNFNTALLHHGLRRLSLTQKSSPNSPSPRLPVDLEGLATRGQQANDPRR
jgi:GxxExxY protein